MGGRNAFWRSASSAVLLFTTFVPALAQTPQTPEADGTAVLAVVGDRSITLSDLRRSLPGAGRTPSGPVSRDELRARLDALVLEESLAAVARAEGYEQRQEVRRAVDRLLAARYRADRLDPKLQALAVSDEEVAAWYAGNAAEFAVPRRARGATVLVAVPKKADARARAALRAKAERALEEARRLPPSTAGFGKIALDFSDDRATRYAGGDVGWLTQTAAADRIGAEAARALFALDEPGALGPVVETAEGFVLVKLVQDRPPATRPLEEVREVVRRRLLVARQEAQEKAFAAAVAQQAGARVDAAQLEKALELLNEGVNAGQGTKPPALPGVPDGPER